MNQRYFICGDKLLALNAKVGTSSFARAIIKRYYPDIEKTITEAAYPEGKNADNQQFQLWIPYRSNPDRPVICLIRDPVERFRSAMAQVGLADVDAAIQELQNETGEYGKKGRIKLVDNVHFIPQSRIYGNPISYYRFPEDIEEVATILDLALPLPSINEASNDKPILTLQQEAAVKDFYSEDLILWNSLQES